MSNKPKASVKQNRWGNWYGYLGRKRVIAFAFDTASLVASSTVMPTTGNSDAPEAAQKWLAEQKN
jgi:hypothetical protein